MQAVSALAQRLAAKSRTLALVRTMHVLHAVEGTMTKANANPELQTKHAQRGDHVAGILEAALKGLFSDYTLEVTRPDMSTRGGKYATLHIQLVSRDGRSFILGCTNTTDHTATLRTLGHTLDLSKRRFGRELVLPPLEYMRFLETATKVLEELSFQVAVVAFDKRSPSAAAMDGLATQTSSRVALVPYLLTLSAVVALGVACVR